MKNIVMLFILFLIGTVSSQCQIRTYAINKITYFPNVFKSDTTITTVDYNIGLDVDSVLIIVNLDHVDTVRIKINEFIIEQRSATDLHMQSYSGTFDDGNPAIIGFADRSGKLIGIYISDGKWLMVYHIYYKPQTEL